MSVDDHPTVWTSRLDQGIRGNSPAQKALDGGELLSTPPAEFEASLKRRYNLLNSLDLLNTLVLDDIDLA